MTTSKVDRIQTRNALLSVLVCLSFFAGIVLLFIIVGIYVLVQSSLSMADITAYNSNWVSSPCKILSTARTVPVRSGGGVFYKYQYNVNYTCNAFPQTGQTLELTTIQIGDNEETTCFAQTTNCKNVRLTDYSIAVSNGVVGILLGAGLILVGFGLFIFVFGIPSILAVLFGYSVIKTTTTWFSLKMSGDKSKMKKKDIEMN
eukprot:gene5356-9164_t